MTQFPPFSRRALLAQGSTLAIGLLAGGCSGGAGRAAVAPAPAPPPRPAPTRTPPPAPAPAAPPIPPPAPGALPDFYADIEQRPFRYFWELANRANGLIPDRWPSLTSPSIAAVAVALPGHPIGPARRGWR